VNCRQWKRTGIFTHHLNRNVSDGDGEKIRPCEALSKVGTLRRAGKLGDQCFTRKSTRDTEARWETWGKGRFSCRDTLDINIIMCDRPIKHLLSYTVRTFLNVRLLLRYLNALRQTRRRYSFARPEILQSQELHFSERFRNLINFLPAILRRQKLLTSSCDNGRIVLRRGETLVRLERYISRRNAYVIRVRKSLRNAGHPKR